MYLNHIGQLLFENMDIYASVIKDHSNGMFQKIVGIMDGTFYKIHPGGTFEQKRYLYSAKEEDYGVKYLGIVGPQGLYHVFAGPYPGRDHDSAIYKESGVREKLRSLVRADGEHYRVMADSGWVACDELIVPFKKAPGCDRRSDDRFFNIQLSTVIYCHITFNVFVISKIF